MAGTGREWRWLAPYIGIVLILFLLGQAVGLAYDSRPFAVMSQYALRIVVLGPFIAIGAVTLLVIALGIRGERQPIRAIAAYVRSRFPSAASAFGAVTAVAMVPILMGSFGTLKMMMPLMRPFNWDDTLAHLDRTLFFGIDPWRITHAVLGEPLPTMAIDFLYTMWVPAVVVGVLAAAVSAPVERARYFLSFGAAWLLIGIVGAYALSSAGPCYADRLGSTTAEWFRPLMSRLANDYSSVGGLGTIGWQDTLWAAYVGREYGFARGISAAPSMHNAICMLYVLALANARPLFRIAAIAFAAVIFVGSVHLGWHYAIDGLLGFAAMIVIWKAAGFYLDWCGYAAGQGAAPDSSDEIGTAEPVTA